MKRRFLIFLAILILQTMWLSEPTIWAEEGGSAKTKSKDEIERILKLRIETKTEIDREVLKGIGLECEWRENEAICNATVNQMDQLKQAGIGFEVEREDKN